MVKNESITNLSIAKRNREVVGLLNEGRIAEALAEAEKIERLAVAYLAETDAERAKAICNLGTIQGMAGNADQAIKTFDRGLRAMRSAVGEDHPQYGRMLGTVGSFLAAHGRSKEAELLFVRSIGILAVSAGNESHVSRVVWDLAELHETLSRHEMANAISREDAELSKKLGEFHYEHCATTLGEREELKGMPPEMREFGEKNLDWAREHFGSMSTHAEARAIVDLRGETGEPFALFLRGFEDEAYGYTIRDPKNPGYPSLEGGISVSSIGQPSKVEIPLATALRGKLSALAVASPATIDPGQGSQGAALPRLILPSESWLDVVRSLIKVAHLIVVDCFGLNNGVRMEIESIVQYGKCDNTVILLHKDRSQLDEEYDLQLIMADVNDGTLESSSSHEWVTKEHQLLKPFKRIGYVEDFSDVDAIASSALFSDLLTSVPLARSATRLGKAGTELIESGNIADGLLYLRASLLVGQGLPGWAERAKVESNYDVTMSAVERLKKP